LHATFMCRPRVDNAIASGWHLHQSLVDAKSGANLFMPGDDGALTRDADGWIAGLLAHAEESCVLTTPTINGYKRYQPFQLAPDRIQWGRDNKGAMIRGLMNPGDRASRVENRVAEPTANPYLFFASQILSGLDGIERGQKAPAPVEDPYSSGAKALPKNLAAAIEFFAASDFYKQKFGADFVRYLTHIKRAEWERYLSTVSEWEQREYFSLY
jgi:glutamine synthetase